MAIFNNPHVDQVEHYSMCERVFRVPVFRGTVSNAGCLEETIIRLYKSISECTLDPSKFDPIRAENSLTIFKNLNAIEIFKITNDNRAEIHMISVQSEMFEQLINQFGASWERLKIQNEDATTGIIFAIIPPENDNEMWAEFEENTLLKMGWEKKEVTFIDGEKKEVTITCENADLIDSSQWHQKCFLYCHSTSGSFIRDRVRAGFYLGMKQDFCFFDPRGMWKSKGTPSEAGFYLDIEAVYDTLLMQKRYEIKNTWVSGYCGAGPVAAYLKMRHHYDGINFIEENSFCNFERDFINTQDFISKCFAKYNWNGLFSQDIPKNIRPDETGFNVEEMWKDLLFYDSEEGGKIILIHAINDHRLSENVKGKYEDLARSVNTSVARINFTAAPDRDAHSDDFFRYPEAKREFVKAIFQGALE